MRRWASDWAKGSWGASHGAASATSRMRSSTVPPNMKAAWPKTRRRSSVAAEGCRTCPTLTKLSTAISTSADADARIEEGVEHVGEQREHDVDAGEHQDDGLHHRKVRAADRLPAEIADAVQREDALDDDRA